MYDTAINPTYLSKQGPELNDRGDQQNRDIPSTVGPSQSADTYLKQRLID